MIITKLEKAQCSADDWAMKCISKAIKELDEFRVSENYVNSKRNVKRIDKARKELINTLFSCGYELQAHTYKAIKSRAFRPLLK